MDSATEDLLMRLYGVDGIDEGSLTAMICRWHPQFALSDTGNIVTLNMQGFALYENLKINYMTLANLSLYCLSTAGEAEARRLLLARAQRLSLAKSQSLQTLTDVAQEYRATTYRNAFPNDPYFGRGR
ncbi:hypothetical protein [Streptomyces sp. NPDC058394]|uniref:hypothetical protein n=1 Tax=Streptomyces sp. NPDC058394 TaxID=3346477 RepID=UPI0036691B5F